MKKYRSEKLNIRAIPCLRESEQDCVPQIRLPAQQLPKIDIYSSALTAQMQLAKVEARLCAANKVASITAAKDIYIFFVIPVHSPLECNWLKLRLIAILKSISKKNK